MLTNLNNKTKTVNKTKNVNCNVLDFNFAGAHINGNVTINVPNVGSIYCGVGSPN